MLSKTRIKILINLECDKIRMQVKISEVTSKSIETEITTSKLELRNNYC